MKKNSEKYKLEKKPKTKLNIINPYNEKLENNEHLLSKENDKKNTSKIKAIEVKGVNYLIDGEPILQDVNITVPLQDSVAILGISGSGKSTLLKLMSGIIEPTSGKVLIFGKDINNIFQRDKLAFLNQHIAFVFQDGGLINNLTVEQNIAIPLTYYGKLPKSEINKIVKDVIEQFNLTGLKNKLPGRLSAGQKRFVSLARVFVQKPEILFLDEPTMNIDMESMNKVIEMVRTFVILGGTVVTVTSDMFFANSISSILGIIDNGRIVEYSTPSLVKISKNKATKKVIKNIYKEADLADEILKLISLSNETNK